MKDDRRALQRAFIRATKWFAVLTAINVPFEQKIRTILLFALPMAWVGWRSLVAGFLMAGIGTLSALIGGAMLHPKTNEPIFIEGLFAYLKLSIVAVCALIGVRLARGSSSRR